MIKRYRTIVNRAVRTILKPISKGVTVFLSLYTILWGLWTLNPWWSVFNSAGLYDGLNGVAPEWFWGLLALSVGLMSLVSTIDNRYPKTAFTSAALAGWFWFVIGLLYLYGDWHNTGGITGLFLSVLCAFIFLNVKANGGYK
jgi:hypothetical protein